MGFIIVVNCKAYPEVMGFKVVDFCHSLATLSSVIVVPSVPMLSSVGSVLPGRVCSPHVDFVSSGAYTGYVSAVELKKIGVKYVLINHSEHRVKNDVLVKTVKLCLSLNLKVIVCAQSVSEVSRFSRLGVFAVAYEPKELIGTNVSVVEKHSIQVVKSVAACKAYGVRLFIGAGVHSASDISDAKKLGAQGIILSHAVCRSKDPQKKIKELMSK